MLKDQIQNLLNLAEDIVLFQRLSSGEIQFLTLGNYPKLIYCYKKAEFFRLTQNITNGAEIRLKLYMTTSRNNMYQRTANDNAF